MFRQTHRGHGEGGRARRARHGTAGAERRKGKRRREAGRDGAGRGGTGHSRAGRCRSRGPGTEAPRGLEPGLGSAPQGRAGPPGSPARCPVPGEAAVGRYRPPSAARPAGGSLRRRSRGAPCPPATGDAAELMAAPGRDSKGPGEPPREATPLPRPGPAPGAGGGPGPGPSRHRALSSPSRG